MSRSRVSSRGTRRLSAVTPVLLLLLACGEGPTAPPTDATVDALLLSRNDGARARGEYTATATFYANEECRETEATVTATETRGRHGGATLDFTYSVLGVCGDAEGLYYYDLSTGGPVAIDPSDIRIQPRLRRATLDTDVVVFDEEGAVFMTVRVRVRWQRTGRGNEGAWAARMEVTSDQLSEQYLTIPLPPAVEAELTRP
jgi:hypothetical protein